MRQTPESFKIAFLGDVGVGKTSTILKISQNLFINRTFAATLGFEFQIVQFNQSRRFQLWDSNGNDKLRTVPPNLLKSAHIIVVMFDVTNADSFASAANFWIKEVRSKASKESHYLLIGNKNDRTAERVVPVSAAADLALKFDMMYLDASCISIPQHTFLMKLNECIDKYLFTCE